MKNKLYKFEFYVNNELRFIKNTVNEKNNLLKALNKIGIKPEVKTIELY